MALYRISPTLAAKSSLIYSFQAPGVGGQVDPERLGTFIDVAAGPGSGSRPVRRIRAGSPTELSPSEVDALQNVGYSVVEVEEEEV